MLFEEIIFEPKKAIPSQLIPWMTEKDFQENPSEYYTEQIIVRSKHRYDNLVEKLSLMGLETKIISVKNPSETNLYRTEFILDLPYTVSTASGGEIPFTLFDFDMFTGGIYKCYFYQTQEYIDFVKANPHIKETWEGLNQDAIIYLLQKVYDKLILECKAFDIEVSEDDFIIYMALNNLLQGKFIAGRFSEIPQYIGRGFSLPEICHAFNKTYYRSNSAPIPVELVKEAMNLPNEWVERLA